VSLVPGDLTGLLFVAELEKQKKQPASVEPVLFLLPVLFELLGEPAPRSSPSPPAEEALKEDLPPEGLKSAIPIDVSEKQKRIKTVKIEVFLNKPIHS